ncbi:hypothetical protein DUI87_10065 [Hirundo rustica rustica]|uniref:AN1-type domain-containing protein n=1 Tax=Hirundo rustica rustica TaxID=333673 RepID=A0A3M0KHI9_HIRRU|nr:hypothetical protein DUI87_10065 [Hirundo rustica rustica]
MMTYEILVLTDFQKKQPDDDSTPSTSSSQSDLFSGETNSDNSNTSLTTQAANSNQQLLTELNVTSPSKEEYFEENLASRHLPQYFSPQGKQKLQQVIWAIKVIHVTTTEENHRNHMWWAMHRYSSCLVNHTNQKILRLRVKKSGLYILHFSPTPPGRGFDSQSESEASPVKRPRLLDDSNDRPEETSRSKQKSRRRCFQCQTKLELVQQELGSCRCGYVFCMLHRLPEQHDCTFDHMGRGREEAIMKMVKLDRKVGRSCQRIGEGCS